MGIDVPILPVKRLRAETVSIPSPLYHQHLAGDWQRGDAVMYTVNPGFTSSLSAGLSVQWMWQHSAWHMADHQHKRVPLFLSP